MPTPNTNSTESNTIRRELGALWSRKGSSGSEYLTGKFRLKDIKDNFDEVKIIVFPNNKKKNDGSPDFQIFMEKAQYETLTGTQGASAPESSPVAKPLPRVTTGKPVAKAAVSQVSADDDLI
jgi:uncharacterized protein (DUF736 family)